MNIISRVLSEIEANPKGALIAAGIVSLCILGFTQTRTNSNVPAGMSRHDKEMRQLNNQLNDMRERQALDAEWDAINSGN